MKSPVYYYRAPFEKVPFVTKRMKAFLRNGFIYLQERHIPIVMTTHFKRILAKRLELSLKFLPKIFEDKRIRDILLKVSE